MKVITFLLALFFAFLAFGYLYKEEMVIKIHTFFNFFVFNDSYIIHYKRRTGLICLLISLFLFFLILNG